MEGVRKFLCFGLFLLISMVFLGTPARAEKAEMLRDFPAAALKCIDCHTRETPGIVANWKGSTMARAGVSCYDCHVVKKDSPMASQCEGVKEEMPGVYTSPMVSPKTCQRCHPTEVNNSAGAPMPDLQVHR